MKKIFFGILAIVAMVATSCQQEMDLGANGGEIATISVEVGTPQMRSFSDGEQARVLKYAVYDANGSELFRKEDESIIGGRKSIKFDLATNRTYTIYFWAQAENAPYTFNGNSIEVDYTNAKCNDEKRDAFYGVIKNHEVRGAATVNVELKRPFAQVNVGASDFAEAAQSGMVPSTSALVVKNVFRTLDLFNGTASNNTDATFAAAAIPSGEDFPYNKAEYNYLAMSYVLVGKDESAHDVTYTINADSGPGVERTIGMVPMRSNYRTNIYGKLLTNGLDVNIDVNPDYNEPGNNEQVTGVKIGDNGYESLAEAYAAAVDGDVLVLLSDQNLSETFVNEKNITINLNGKAIRQEKANNAHYEMIRNNGTLTIIDEAITRTATTGKISFQEVGAGDPNFDWGSYTIGNYGTLVVDGGTIENLSAHNSFGESLHMYCAIQQGSGAVSTTINGGTISTPSYRSIRVNSGTLTIKGGVFNGQIWMQPFDANTALTINDGSFAPRGGDSSSVFVENTKKVVFSVTGGTFSTKIGATDPSAEGVKGAIKGGTFTTAAKENTNAALIAKNYDLVDNGDGNWTVESPGYYVDASGNYHITTAKGWLWIANQSASKFSYKTIYLDNDIDFSGVNDIKPIVFKVWEAYTTFDGQNHTISNVYMAKNYQSNNQALFDGLITVKNLNIVGAHVYGQSRVGIIGAQIYGDIINCHVKNARSYGYVWQVGGIVGLHSTGSIKNCSIENSTVECYYYGAVGALVGTLNESASGQFTDCSVKNVQLIKEGNESEYADYDTLFGIIAGYSEVKRDFVVTCEIENTTIRGVASQQLFGEIPAGSTVTYNGVK